MNGEEQVGRITWVSVDAFAEDRPYCETPRHAGELIPSRWVYAFVGIGPEDGVEIVCAACEDCMAEIAVDLGTTPAEGAKA